MTEVNKAVARRWLEELWSRGNLSAAGDLVARAYVRHDPDLPVTGVESYAKLVQAYRGAFEGLRFTCEDLVAEDDKVLVRWKARAAMRGGAERELDGADLLRIVDGRIVESWPLYDGLRLLREIGIFRFGALVLRLRRAVASKRSV